MAKKKYTQTASGNKFAGVQREERTMSALPIRIDYQSPRSPHVCRPQGNDYLLCEAPSTLQDVGPLTTEAAWAAWNQQLEAHEYHDGTPFDLDPYAIREAFFAVEDPTTATRFLSEAGRFWPLGGVLWSQFQKWQEFFRWLQLPYDKAKKDPEGMKAWHAAENYDQLFVEVQPIPDWVREESADLFEKSTRRRRQTIIDLHHFAMRLERSHRDCISIKWSAVGDKSFKPMPPVREFKGKEQKPYLCIEVHNILEAIAATVYADRCSGVTHERCKECGKLFRVESEHGREFCPAPAWLNSSPCNNRYTQRQRRARIKEKALAKKKRSPAR